jgi:Peptidase family M28
MKLPPPSARDRALSLVVLAFLGLAVLAAWWTLAPPAPATEQAPPGVFSAGRAFRHVSRLADAPRPTGSLRHARARDFIAEELRRLRIEPDIAVQQAISTWYGLPFDSASVENVVGRIPGRASTGAVLLAAHYDSVPAAPGASDDGSGVAVLLEVARALGSLPPLDNDVILLFTDGEEGGMLGAAAFADEHRAMGDVRVLLNFDARGTSGPPAVINATKPNGWLADELAGAGITSAASSLAPQVARRMHSGTDYGVLTKRGIAGLNIAFADGVARYHAGADVPGALDLGTLQAEGDLALALVRRLGGVNLAAPPGGGDSVFFGVGGVVLARYPLWWAPYLSIAALLALALAARLAHRRVALRRVLLAALALVGTPAAAAGLAWAVWALLDAVHPVYGALRRGDPYDVGALRVGMVLLGAAIALGARRLLAARIHPLEHALAGALFWAPIAVATSLFVPGASYIAVIPLLVTSAVIAVEARRPEGPRSPRSLLVPLAGAAMVAAIAVQVVYLVFVAAQMPGAGLAVAVIVFYLALVPALGLIDPTTSRGAAIVALVLGVTCIAGASAAARFDDERPRPTTLAYGLDATLGESFFFTDERRASEWSARFVPADAPSEPMPAFFLDATQAVRWARVPQAPLAPPELILESDRALGDRRALGLRIRSPRGAPWAHVFLVSATPVLAARIEGRGVDPAVVTGPIPPGERWGFRHMGLRDAGLRFEIEVNAGGGPVKLRVVDQSFELPPVGVPPRPAGMAAARSWIADSTLVSREVVF